MYVLGIDGGGTKTAVAIMNEKGNILGTSVSGPSSIDTVTEDVTRKNIMTAIENILKEKNLTDIEFSSVFAGLGGISGTKDELAVEKLLESIPYVKKGASVVAKNDVSNAHAGGLAAKPGIAIIIGTGAVAFGVDEFNNEKRCGGYSFKEGDAGSAYDLGFQCLKVLARALDGRYETTLFTEDIKKTVEVYSFTEAVKVFESYFTDRTKTAQLAKLVTKHGDLGDRYAMKIIETATDELALLIEGVDKFLKLKNKEVAIIGSLGNADTIYKKKFIEKVKKINPDFNVHSSLMEPVNGAALMALKNAGVTITDKIIKSLI